MSERYFTITFPSALVKEPVLYSLVEKYGLEPVVYQASIISSTGWLALSLSGPADKVNAAIVDLKCRGALVREGDAALMETGQGAIAALAVRVRLTIPEDKVREPLFSRIIREHGVVINIRHARISGGQGSVDMEISGMMDAVEAAIASLKNSGTLVDPIERNVIE